MYRSHVLVCGGTGCTSSGSQQIMETLKVEIEKAGLQDEVSVVQTGCHGLCALGPIMIVYPDASFYSMVKVEDIPEIVQEHLLKGRVVTRLLYDETVTPSGVKALIDTDFYKKQHRIALRNCGIINPEVIDEYIGTGGYEALGKVLTEMTPDDVIQCLLDSGLRGRGGAGFPTGLKWKFAKQNDADQKYVCCNADEGDPGAFMDRSVLEGDPHAVLEAMAIAGYAIGATQGYIYVRAEYPIAVKRLQVAIGQARELGLLGLYLNPAKLRVYPGDPRMTPLYELCRKEGKPIIFHAGLCMESHAIARYAHPMEYEEIADRYPDVNICLTHVGWPWVQETAALLIKYPNLYTNTALMSFDGPYQLYRKVFREDMGQYWVEHNIAGQVMFGSGSPRIRPVRSLRGLESLGFERETMENICWKNALRFLGREG